MGVGIRLEDRDKGNGKLVKRKEKMVLEARR
jgi:hypothetical protein